MNIFMSFRLAIKSIAANKMRSLLTMLGMIVGVGAVILIMGLSSGITGYVLDQFSNLGANNITLTFNGRNSRIVKDEELYSFAKKYPELYSALSPNVTGAFNINAKDKRLEMHQLSGVSEEYDKIKEIELESGRFLDYADIDSHGNVAVIGTYVRNKLFSKDNVIGDKIKINGENFTVVGVKKEEGDSEEASEDDVIYIPYTKALRMTYQPEPMQYTLLAKESDTVTRAKTVLDDFIYSKTGDSDVYTIITMKQLLSMIDKMMNMFGIVLGGIAGVSLVVAGIGIMNIMLVSVTERTREIGIRKSLGARRSNILSQFMIEAATLSAIGGIIGIIIGSVMSINVGTALNINAVPTLSSILISFLISAGIGLIFGYAPARKAAGLNPIDALRSE